MKNGRMQAKDIPDRDVLAYIAEKERKERSWTSSFELRDHFGVDFRLILAKCQALVSRKLLDGCACGCRGDFEITKAGEEYLAS